MKLTFSKTILATIVLGLTACGSSGGGKSSPTTSAKRDYITVPKTNHIFSQPPKKTNTTANTTSSTGNSSAVSSKPSENPNNNMAENRPATSSTLANPNNNVAENRPATSSTFATNNDGLPRGTATYYSSVDINPETFIKMNVDFDKGLVSGNGVLQGINAEWSHYLTNLGSYDEERRRYDKNTLIDLQFSEATLFIADRNSRVPELKANGIATGTARNTASEKFSGGYIATVDMDRIHFRTELESNTSNKRSVSLYNNVLTRQ